MCSFVFKSCHSVCAFLFCVGGEWDVGKMWEITFPFSSGYEFNSAQNSDHQVVDSLSALIPCVHLSLFFLLVSCWEINHIFCCLWSVLVRHQTLLEKMLPRYCNWFLIISLSAFWKKAKQILDCSNFHLRVKFWLHGEKTSLSFK